MTATPSFPSPYSFPVYFSFYNHAGIFPFRMSDILARCHDYNAHVSAPIPPATPAETRTSLLISLDHVSEILSDPTLSPVTKRRRAHALLDDAPSPRHIAALHHRQVVTERAAKETRTEAPERNCRPDKVSRQLSYNGTKIKCVGDVRICIDAREIEKKKKREREKEERAQARAAAKAAKAALSRTSATATPSPRVPATAQTPIPTRRLSPRVRTPATLPQLPETLLDK